MYYVLYVLLMCIMLQVFSIGGVLFVSSDHLMHASDGQYDHQYFYVTCANWLYCVNVKLFCCLVACCSTQETSGSDSVNRNDYNDITSHIKITVSSIKCHLR